MISVATGFQSSVNIAYDLNDDSKIKNYIPTKSALSLLKDILLSTSHDSTDRARILIGAYGKGKSHIVLMILSVLLRKELTLFEKMLPSVQTQAPELYHLIQSYYSSTNRILPVVISGTSNSLTQAFMLALERTLLENELTDIMPDTNFKAAVSTIQKWKNDFPDTYVSFEERIGGHAEGFIKRLRDYDPSAYVLFESIYPSLTAGSSFNPFMGFDVADLYSEVVKALKQKGYTGIYVVYDEFSKYLENHISDATRSDTKMLQDFAEKCGRSGSFQLHLMLISHKEITSYIDRASKSMVDGWRGVSERFRHVYLNNNFTQTYEIIAAAIEKDTGEWQQFVAEHLAEIEAVKTRYSNHPIFSDLTEDGIRKIVYDCYPLHPVSTFILPRLSEQVAQNERTLFTFISANGDGTLSHFLKGHSDREFVLATPDLIYDYFEPLLKQELYSGNLHKYYVLTSAILRKIEAYSLEAKIVKTLALTYILEHFEKLQPTLEELTGIYASYGADAVNDAVKRLVEDKFVVYLKRSNNYLRLKESSGVDVHAEIANMVEMRAAKLDIKTVLNDSNFDHYLYPAAYNDEKNMTRYFDFRFVDSSEVRNDTNWNLKREGISADGVVFAVIPDSSTKLSALKSSLISTSKDCRDCMFVIPKKYSDIRSIVAEYDAVSALMQKASDDPVLFEDYEIVYEDMRDILRTFISSYTRPEKKCSEYIYAGKERKNINRKSDFSNQLSCICRDIYNMTPIINNEVINKQEITTTTRNSRYKVIAALLRSELESDLGLSGTGQEVSIMRSTVLNTGILNQSDPGNIHLNLKPEDDGIAGMLHVIEDFVKGARKSENTSFAELYSTLMGPARHIGIRKGLIPIFLAVVLHEYKREIVISDRNSQVPINADTLELINADPGMFTIAFIDWGQNKEAYISSLEKLFGQYAADDRNESSYERVMNAMHRWYMELPKYSKNAKTICGETVSREDRQFLQEIWKNSGSYTLIFESIPRIYGFSEVNEELADRIGATKEHFDNALRDLKMRLIKVVRNLFCLNDSSFCEKMSLASIIRDFCDRINPAAFDQLFNDGTERCLALFKSVTNDEDLFISRAAKMATDLRMEDWDDEVAKMFEKNMKQYRETAENFKSENDAVASDLSAGTGGYELSFQDATGHKIVKRFDKVESSKRGQILHREIMSALTDMGQSISEQEKRQILMEILKSMC